MINVIANIVGVAIAVGAIATVLDKRINALQSEIHRNKRQAETRLNRLGKEVSENDDFASLTVAAVKKAQSDVNMIIDKVEEISRDLRGETYAIEFWGGGCYGGFKKNGDPIKVDYDEAVLLTRHEAELIRNKFGTGVIVNRSKTILKNLEDK